MRSIRTAILIIALSTIPVSLKAAETMLRPTFHICRDVTASTENAGLTLMWVVGYVSGINNLSKVDFLRGRSMEAIIDHFRDVCIASPAKTVLDASRDVVGRLRIEYMQRYPAPKSK
jgi:hypothetical protein